MANTNFDHPIYKAIAQLIEGGEDMELNAFIDGGRGDLYLEAPRNASALYAEGCDPITAQYLATGELPG